MGETKGLGQRDVKRATRDCFIFISWIFSKGLAETEMDVGARMIGMIKNNATEFCKYDKKNMKKNSPLGY